MNTPLNRFPRLLKVLQEGIDRRLHTCVQIFVSLNDKVILDCGFGMATKDRPLDERTPMLWRSAGKPLVAALIMQFVEQGRLSLHSPLHVLLPETAATGKSDVTLLQLLTHVSGFPAVETGWPQADWNESVQRVLNAPLQFPAGTAAYHPLSSWFLLGEILLSVSAAAADGQQTFTGEDFEVLMRERLLKPLGMMGSAWSLPPQQAEQSTAGVPLLYDRDRGQLIESPYNKAIFRIRSAPGGSLRGPAADIARFYQMLCRGGLLPDGSRFLDSSTVGLMTFRQRKDQYDHTLQHTVDFGLGLFVDSRHHGPESVPYGFGPCSASTFGHGGSQCSMAFCDPERQLVVAWAANGFCGEGQHQRRNRAINEAIYDTLE